MLVKYGKRKVTLNSFRHIFETFKVQFMLRLYIVSYSSCSEFNSIHKRTSHQQLDGKYESILCSRYQRNRTESVVGV